ncbi:MAG: superoxide dismutase family protein [Sporomusaceae bacterium]|nr:superoxide dismutase family protein [Sporomusaceae bacterium]
MQQTNRPCRACAKICGSDLAPRLRGQVCFFDVPGGTWVEAAVYGLPRYRPAPPGGQPIGPHGFHIHAVGDCEHAHSDDPFETAGAHWNPDNQPHGNHAGDFPVLFSNHGTAIMHFFTDRFCVSDVIGKAVIIHQNPDDYRTQPSGNSGKRIGCGVIRPCR